MSSRAFVEDRLFCYRDYLAWDSDRRYELIDGVPMAMAPAPSPEHQELAGRIYAQLAAQLDGQSCRPFVAPVDVRLPKPEQTDEDTDTVVQPDVFVICDRSKVDSRGVRGAPDFIVEVLSPATAARDQIVKRKLYERAGVREYWHVHPTDRLLTIYRLAGGTYAAPEVVELSNETSLAALPGVSISWEPIVRALGPRPE